MLEEEKNKRGPAFQCGDGLTHHGMGLGRIIINPDVIRKQILMHEHWVAMATEWTCNRKMTVR